MNNNEIMSISISGRITLDMHSLNNEGTEGNQVLTRQVTIIDENGKPVTVTAISGDMVKHITTEHFWKIASENSLPLSNTSKKFDANRILKSDLNGKSLKNQDEIMDAVIQICSLSDVAGAMITEGGNFARKSIIEYGWFIALPDANETDNYFHAKFVSDAKAKKEEATSDEAKESNIGQNIFHRPANSGIYAFVVNIEVGRLSYNDISKKYPINDEDRKKRYEALLKSVLYTFIKLNGAMRNTQNPHMLNFEGVITYSNSSCPAPLVSGLKTNYIEDIKKTVENLNKMLNNNSKKLEIKEFKNLSEFTETFEDLLKKSPAKLPIVNKQ